MNTTKKIISLLMCLLMVMSIIPVSASAAGGTSFAITSKKLEWIITGSTILKSSDFTLPSSSFVIYSVTSKEKDASSPMGETDTYIGGKTYTVGIHIGKISGNFTPDQVSGTDFTVNGIPAKADYMSGKVMVTFDFTVRKEVLETFSLDAEGYRPGVFAGDFTLTTDCVGLTVRDYYFQYRDLNQKVPLTDLFETGGNYYLWVELYLKDGFFLPDDFDPEKFRLIDIPCQSKELYHQDEDENGSYFVLKIVPVTPTYVSSLELVLDGYEYGAEVGDIKVSADECAEFKDGDSYSKGYGIFINDGKDLITDEDVVFGYDTQYYLGVRLLAKNGYSFYNLTKMGVTLKGYSCNFEFDKKSDKEVILYFALPRFMVTVLNNVSITVPAPVVGKSPSLSDVTATEGIKIESIEWEDSEGNVLGATDVFRERQTYSYTVVFTGMPGYNIATNATYQLNEYDVFAYDVPEAPAKKYVYGVADTFTHIESIGVSFDGYEAGKKITDIALNFTTEGVKLIQDGYLLNGNGGYYVSDDASGDNIITDGTFEIGKKYYIQLCLVPENNYYKFDTFISSGIMVPAGCSAINFGKVSEQVFFTIELPVLEHECGNYLDSVKGEAAECLNDGTIAHYICTYDSCGKKYSDDKATTEITDTVISAPGHNFMMTFPKVDASCGAEGRKEAFRVCKRCGNRYSLTDENTPLTDAYIESIRIPATGAHTYDNACDAECNVCKTSRTPAAHKGGTATCKVKAKCSVCGSEYGSLKADNHKNITVLKAVSATYKATGLTEGKKCTDCGTVTVPQNTVAKKILGKVTGIKTKAVKLSSGTKTTLTLAWNKVEGAEAYEIEQRVGKTWKYVGTTKKTSLTVKKLKANKSYKFRVRAVIDGATPGTYSKTFTAKTVPLKTTLTLKAGKKALTASWKTVANITGYEVQYSTSKKFTKKTTKTVTIKKAKTKKTTIKKLSKSKKYYVKVRAYKTAGKTKIYSAWSSVKTVKVK